MKPNPFLLSNHLTLPLAIVVLLRLSAVPLKAEGTGWRLIQPVPLA
jgi:hypothetical protein